MHDAINLMHKAGRLPQARRGDNSGEEGSERTAEQDRWI